jgi:hypothetical protein
MEVFPSKTYTAEIDLLSLDRWFTHGSTENFDRTYKSSPLYCRCSTGNGYFFRKAELSSLEQSNAARTTVEMLTYQHSLLPHMREAVRLETLRL